MPQTILEKQIAKAKLKMELAKMKTELTQEYLQQEQNKLKYSRTVNYRCTGNYSSLPLEFQHFATQSQSQHTTTGAKAGEEGSQETLMDVDNDLCNGTNTSSYCAHSQHELKLSQASTIHVASHVQYMTEDTIAQHIVNAWEYAKTYVSPGMGNLCTGGDETFPLRGKRDHSTELHKLTTKLWSLPMSFLRYKPRFTLSSKPRVSEYFM